MAIRTLLIILNLCYVVYLCEGAPQFNFAVVPGRNPPMHYATYHPQGRPFLGSIGDWITNSEWFPIEVNVPDVISSITGTIANGIPGLAQRIPFIHRLTSPERPRPLQYFIIIPSRRDGGTQNNRNDFNPFASGTEMFPHYP